MDKKPTISMIAAIGKRRELGHRSALLWSIPEDMKRLKKLTMGKPIIMGRTTFESIGRALPGRTNIVATLEPFDTDCDIIIVYSLFEALEEAKKTGADEVFIFGGGEIYTQMIKKADKLYLTEIHDTKEADTFFPEFKDDFPLELYREDHLEAPIPFSFVELARERKVARDKLQVASDKLQVTCDR